MNKFLQNLTFLVFIISSQNSFAQAYQWAKSGGGTGTDIGISLAADVSGNNYVMGYYQGSPTFGADNPGTSTTLTAPTSATYGIFIAKYDALGNLQWAKKIGESATNTDGGIKLSPAGDYMYVLASFTGSATIGSQTISSSGQSDVFLAKFSNTGVFSWVIKGGGLGLEEAGGLDVDPSGNIYITGTYTGAPTFIGVKPTDNTILSNAGSSSQIFLGKLSAEGNFEWIKGEGRANGNDRANSITVDVNGNPIITGSYESSTVLGEQIIKSPDATGASNKEDIFIAKFDTEGVFSWAYIGEDKGKERGRGLGTDAAGNIYSSGYYTGSVTFRGKNNGAITLNSVAKSADMYIVKYAPDGTLVWATTAGGPGDDQLNDVNVDKDGNMYLTGFFTGTATFNGTTLTSKGGTDVYMAKYDTNGNRIYAHRAGSTGNDTGNGISIDGAGNSYLTGFFAVTADFGKYNVISKGGDDMFVARMALPLATTPLSDKFCVGATFTLDYTTASTFNAGNIFTAQLSDATGDFSNPTVIGSASNTAFGSISSFIPTNVPSGTGYRVRVVASNPALIGTDNDFDLTISNLTQGISAGSNSPVCVGSSLNLTATAVAGATYSWTGPNGFTSNLQNPAIPTVTASVAGTYSVTVSASGCTKTFSVSVVVNALPIADAGADKFICVGASATFNATGGISYSWTGPNGFTFASQNFTISNATTAMSGTYTVTVTDANGCTNTDQAILTVTPPPTVNAGPAQTVCLSDASFTFTGYSPAGGTWSGTGVTTAGQFSPSAAGVGSHTLTYSYSQSGCTVTAIKTITVITVPSTPGTITGSTTLCEAQTNNSYSISAITGATGYTWTVPSGYTIVSGQGTTSVVITAGSSNGNISVVANNNCGASVARTLGITINPLPAAPTVTGADRCGPGAVTLTASGAPNGGSYKWYTAATGGTAISGATTAPYTTPSLSASTTYYVAAANSLNCEGPRAAVTATIKPIPTVSASVANNTICVGGSTQLTASGADGYSWSPATGLSNTNTANPTANPTTTTTYTVTGTTNGCSSTATVTITVNPLPVANAGNDVSICAGTSTTLSASGGVSYSWSPAAGLSATNIANPVASPSATTTYTVEVTDANGCKNTDQVVVTVVPRPILTVSAASTSICVGSATTLSASGATTYSWFPSTGLSNTNIANPTANPTTTTTYTVTGITNGCSSTATVTITVNPLPVTNAGNDVSICAGTSTTLSATGGVSYSWSPAAGLSATNIANPVASPSATTTYTVEVTDANGCKNTDLLVVTVKPLPVADAGADKTICSGLSGTLGATAISDYNYSWSPATGLSDATAANPGITLANLTAAPVSYTYTVTSTLNGCSTSDQVVVTVNPAAVANAGADKVTCSGRQVSLGTGATTGYTYKWLPATGLSDATAANPDLKLTNFTTAPVNYTYTVTTTNAYGCVATDEVTVTVNPYPVADAGTDKTFCSGLSATLGTTATSGYTYAWSPATGLSDASAANPTISLTNLTGTHVNYTYTVTTTAFGCTTTDQVIVTVNPAVVASAGNDVAICIGGTTTLSATGGISYSWSGPNGFTSTSQNPVISNATAAMGGTYTVTVTDARGCVGTDQVILTVKPIPVVTAAAANSTICTGTSTQLTASGATTYSWSPATGLSATNIANPTANPTTTTTYIVTGTTNGCSSTATVTITVNPLPVANAGNDVAVCSGLAATLGTVATTGYTYSWSPINGLSDATAANPTVTLTNTGTTVINRTYTVSATLNNCTTTDQVVVTVYPAAVANAGSDKTICSGATTTIGAAPVAGNTYSWSPANGISSASVANPNITLTNTGLLPVTSTYTLTVTTANGCIISDQVNVTVNPLPVAYAGTDQTICSAGSATLGNPAVPGYTYSWSPATGLSDATSANPTVTLTNQGTAAFTSVYTVTATLNGCSTSDQVAVTVNPLPVASAGSDVTICAGESANLLASGGISYLWSPTTGLSRTNIANPVASPSATTTYMVEVTDANGCKNTAQVTVKVNPLPIATITANGPTTLCQGGSVTLTASAASSYLWSNGLTTRSITVGASGNYWVTITDANTCAATSAPITVQVNPLPIANAGTDATICAGSTTTLTASGGVSYSWSPATGLSNTNIANPVASPAVTTTYTVSATDANGCSSTDQVTVNVNPLPVAAITTNQASTFCQGGAVTLTSTPGASYLWSTGETTRSITVTTSGNYTVTVTDANGCSATSNPRAVNVNALPVVAISASGNTTFCQGGSVTLTAPEATTYAWSNGLATRSITVSQSGAYKVIITDANGCSSASEETAVTVNPLPVATIKTNGPTTFCQGGAVTLIASEGISYRWSNGATTRNIEVAASGNFSVTVKDANECEATSAPKTVVVNPLPTASAGSNRTICLGASTTLAASGGVSYTWSPTTGLSATNIASPVASPSETTTYTVIVTDANGCSSSDEVVVNVNPLPVATITAGSTTEFCAGGSVTLTASEGVSYRWSNNQTSRSIMVAQSGNYSVRVTDANGCSATSAATQVKVNSVQVIAGPNMTICPGGSANLAASGAATYSWSPATGLDDATSANPVATPSATTTYTVTGTSVNGCISTAQVTVYVTTESTVSVVASQATICVGGSTNLTATGASTYSWSPATGLSNAGIANPIASPTQTTTYTVTGTSAGCGVTSTATITITVNSRPVADAGADQTICAGASTAIGSAAISGNIYSWSPATGLSNANISDPVASPNTTTTYKLTVQNAAGCISTDSVTVKVNPLPVATITASGTTTFCDGGSVTLTASAGVSYLWNNGATTQAINVTASGNYTVKVTDANGCFATSPAQAVQVNSFPVATITASGPTTFCQGGSVTLTAPEAASYAWSGGQTTRSITVNSSGTHAVTITNAGGCATTSASTRVVVNELPVALISASGATNFCAGGSVILTASSGKTYLWSNGDTTRTITVTQGGNYTVAITNANGCTATAAPKVITVYNLPVATITPAGATPICHGTTTTLTASEGSSYAWSTGATTRSITVSAAGNYSVTVYNINGCGATSASTSINVNELPVATISANGPTAFCQGGSVQLSASEGVSYLWSTGETTRSIQVSTAGAYTVRVTDSNGCSATSSPENITVNPLPVATISASGPTSFCNGGQVILTASQGTDYAWSTGETTRSITVSVSGNYSVTVTNANGCSQLSPATQVTVTPQPLAMISAGGSTTLCSGEKATLTASAGASYLWSNGETSRSIEVGTSGNYAVTITNSNGCTSTSPATPVVVYPLPVATVTADGPTAFCAGGSVTLMASAGDQYLWSTGETTSAITVTQTGNFWVKVINANGCEKASSALAVTAYPNPVPVITANRSTTLCAGEQVILTASEGASYAWSTGETTRSITVNSTGDYYVSITNANNCQSVSANTAVLANGLPVAAISANGPTVFCDGGSVNLTATEGAAYLWSNGATSRSIQVNTSGNYTVQVTNENNCLVTSPATAVQVYSLPTATITANRSTTLCAGEKVILTASEGASYLWSNGATTRSIEVNTAGNYSVTVSNAHACVVTSAPTAVIVNTLPVATISAAGQTTFCQGEKVTLTASAGASYLWSNGATSRSIEVSTSGEYFVTVTNAANCSVTSGKVTVTVLPVPVATITPSGSTTFCQNGSVSLMASAGASYLWSNGETSESIILSQSGNYTVTITNAQGCATTSAPVRVTVNPLPVAHAGADVIICRGTSTNLVATGGVSYSWNPAIGLNNANIANPVATPTQTTTYTVAVTNAAGCITTDEVTITVNPLPVAAITADGPTTFCEGGSVKLTASAGDSYLWNNGSTARTITVTKAGNYSVAVTGQNGCVATSAFTTISITPVVVSAGNNVTICPGSSANLLASGAANYTWSPATGLSSTTVANPVANPTQTTTYTVTGTSADGCTKTATVTVTVKALPAITASATNTTVCAGTGTQLNATGADTYTWSPSTGLSNPNIANPTASPRVTTTYTVTGISDGCINSSVGTVTIVVNPLPVADAGADVTICKGSSANLEATGGVSYSWSPATGLSNASIANPVATPTQTTTYTVTVTSTDGCQATDQVTVVVRPDVIAAISANRSTTLCQGESVILTATQAAKYAWSTGETTQTITVADAGNYSVTITDANGCTITAAPVAVTVNALPVADAGADVTIESGGSATIGTPAKAGIAYSWSPATGLSDANAAMPGISLTNNDSVAFSQIYTLTIAQNGCTSTDAVVVTVNPAKQAIQPEKPITANAGSDGTICSGTAITLGANAVAGYSYTWSPATGLSDAHVAQPVMQHTNQSATADKLTYILTVSDANGKTATDEVTITVNPEFKADAGTDKTIEVETPASGSVTISAELGAPAIAGYTYSWSPSTGLSDATAANPILTLAVDGVVLETKKYTLTVTGSTGCTATDEVTITINPIKTNNQPQPGEVILPTQTICAGNTIQLAAESGASYSWSPATGLNNATIATPLASPIATTTYTATITLADGSIRKNRVTVKVNAAPVATVTASGPTTLCAGQKVTLTAAESTSYAWSTGETSRSIVVSEAGAYAVVVSNANGCSTASSEIFVDVVAAPVVNAGADVTLCNGSSATLAATTGGVTYSWSPASGLSNASIANPVVNIAQTTTYTVTVTNANGCTATDQVTVNVGNLAVQASATEAKICAGNATTLSATGATTYTWSPATGLSATNVANPTANPTQTTTYTVTGTTNGCTATATVTVEVLPKPVVKLPMLPEMSITDSVLVLPPAEPAGGVYSGIGVKDGKFSPMIAGAGTHTITYTYSSDAGCTVSTSTAITVEDLPPLAFKIYPNPTNGILNIELGTRDEQVLKITFFNMASQLVLSEERKHNATSIIHQVDLSRFGKGVYLMQLVTKNGLINERIVVH